MDIFLLLNQKYAYDNFCMWYKYTFVNIKIGVLKLKVPYYLNIFKLKGTLKIPPKTIPSSGEEL